MSHPIRPVATLACSAALAAALSSCSSAPPELPEAMETVCDEGTVTEPEPSSFPDYSPEDWPDAVERLDCMRDGVELSGFVYEEDPADRLSGTSDSVDSGDGSDYWTAVADGDGRWVVVTFSAYPSDENADVLAPLEDEGFEVDG